MSAATNTVPAQPGNRTPIQPPSLRRPPPANRPPGTRPVNGRTILAPMSEAAAELLHALYADALGAAEASLPTIPAGAIVLPPPMKSGLSDRGWSHASHGYRRISLASADRDYSLQLQTPFVGDPDHTWTRPGVWYGSEVRVDPQGRRWESTLPTYFTTDDFGDLVEVLR